MVHFAVRAEMRTCAVAPTRTTGGNEEDEEEEEEVEVEEAEEGGGKNVSFDYQQFLARLVVRSRSSRTCSFCLMHAGTVLYTSVALHADAVV